MPRTTTPRRFPSGPLRLTSGPWEGVTDSEIPGVAAGNRLRALTNMYVPPGPRGLPVVGRPGFTAMGAQLGGVGQRKTQFLGQFTELDGTRHTIAVVGGKFYTYDWGIDTWTEILTASNFSGASITLSTSARVWMSVLNNKALFHDSTNTPWSWDGTSGGGLLELTNCPVLYGPTWVYYAKYFGVKAAERNAFVWSEEGDPTIGYEAGGYLNVWAPMGATRFFGGCATNDAMYVHEENRIIRIQGAVSTDFTTAGTRSDVSEKTGSTAGMLVTDLYPVFLSSQGEPHLIAGLATGAWADCASTVADVPLPSVENSLLVYWPTIDAVLIGVPGNGETNISKWLIMRPERDGLNFVGVWDVGVCDYGAVVLDDTNTPTFIFAGEGDGRIYRMGQPNGTLWEDGFASGSLPIAHGLTTAALASDADLELRYDRATVICSSPTNNTALTFRYRTPRGISTPLTQNVAAGGDLLGVSFVLGTSVLSGNSVEQRTTWGLNGRGRDIEVTFAHGFADERLGVKTLTVLAHPSRDDPYLP